MVVVQFSDVPSDAFVVAMVLVLVFFVAQMRFGRDHEGGSGRARGGVRSLAHLSIPSCRWCWNLIFMKESPLSSFLTWSILIGSVDCFFTLLLSVML